MSNFFSELDVEYCDYTEVNEKILDFLENDKPSDYGRIFITDISFNEEVAEKLDMIHRGRVSCVQLVDHHGTASWLDEKYPDWCLVRTLEPIRYDDGLDREVVASSGTSLLFNYLNAFAPQFNFNLALEHFADTVRKYDSWEWNNIYKDDHPKQLNDLLYLIGREEFVKRFTKDPSTTFTDSETLLLKVENYRINKYIWGKKREVKTTEWTIQNTTSLSTVPYDVAYVFAEQNTSLLGNAIAEHYGDEIDFVAVIDIANDKVSLRGIHDGIDLGKDVAKVYGGGGHAKAAAFSFSPHLKDNFFESLL